MSPKTTAGSVRLLVPLDASKVTDFKPDRAVKVVAFDGQGRAYEDIVKLDAKGHGTASLALESAAGGLHVVVGPEDATAEQMRGLQTISVEVAPRQWAGKAELTLSPVLISSYYWWWWWRWCRPFRITGVVRCANGLPVPGAKVCAYDVDWWWWWWSNQQVGCATTDQNGAFEINFTWCCGWWPWWWWARRVWYLEPTLADKLSRLLRRELKTRIPIPDPQPDPAIFERLLGDEVGPRALMRSSRGAAMPSLGAAARSTRFDPSSLDSLRKRLAARLPVSPELERLKIWPWWPWWPWWDCTPDVIFKVTQNCHGTDKVIVDETAWDARWDIPQNLDVTLVGNDEACCVVGSTCLDGGSCGFISNICEDNLDDIGGNPGMSAGASQVGYLNPGLVSADGDRPYSGTVPVRGCVGDAVDYYEILVSTNGFGGPWNSLPTAAAGGLTRSYWDNGLSQWVNAPFLFNPISDGVTPHDVIESVPHYETNNGPKLWDFFTLNILFELITQNVLADGTYYLRLRGWTRPGYAGNLSNPIDLPVCGSANLTGIAITIDNHLVTGAASDLNGHPCLGTVHVCTTEPDTEVVSIKIVHLDSTTTDVGACSNVHINETDILQIDFVAYDPDPKPHLRNYELSLHYDINLLTDLLNSGLAGWSLAPSPIPPVWTSAAAQVGPDYGDALGQGAVSPYWAGGAVRLRCNAKAVFPYTCCYQLRLAAHKRVIGGGGTGCDHSKWNQYNLTEYSFTITV